MGAQAQLNATPVVKRRASAAQRSSDVPRSRYMGVCWYPKGERNWRAYIHLPGSNRMVSAGINLTEEAPAQAYNAKALELIGPHAPLNDVPPAPPAPPKPASPARSGHRGVFWSNTSSKWQAQLQYKAPNGRWKTASAGLHESELAAAQAYNLLARKVLGDAAQLNDVPEPDPDAAGMLPGRRQAAASAKHGYRGVYWHKPSQRWRARVAYTDEAGQRKLVQVGRFSDVHQAARAYNAKALQLLGPGAELNDVPEGV